MKKGLLCLLILPLSACMFGPRPFDGTLGYTTQTQPTGVQVTYVEEAKVASEKTLGHIRQVCAAALAIDATHVGVTVLSESEYRKNAVMNIAIPVGAQDNGSSKSGPSGSTMHGVIAQKESVTRSIPVRETVARCEKP